MSRHTDVAIVGAGLSGLSTGLALAGAGREVVVLDTRPPVRTDHWGLVLWPPGTATLAALGVLDDVLEAGSRIGAIRMCGPDGHDYVDVRTGPLGAGTFAGVLPSRLDAVLLAHARRAGVVVHDDAGPVSVRRRDDGWELGCGPDGQRTVRAAMLLAADGPHSPTRDALGLPAQRWRPAGQVVLTGIGGAAPAAESRQTLGPGWSAGYADLGDRTWVYAVTGRAAGDAAERVRSAQLPDPALRPALDGLRDVAEIRPTRVRARRWATDGALLVGDAAHAMLPYLGLGGTLSLEEVPHVVDVVTEAFRHHDFTEARLARFRRERIHRVAYAQRLSSLMAMTLTHGSPALGAARRLHLRRLRRHDGLVRHYFRDIATTGVPSVPTRVRLGLP